MMRAGEEALRRFARGDGATKDLQALEIRPEHSTSRILLPARQAQENKFYYSSSSSSGSSSATSTAIALT
jgi:hypothetical protein